jgi:hypothetical protein
MMTTKTMLGALAGALLMATAASAEFVPTAQATPTDRACIMHHNLWAGTDRDEFLPDREVYRAGVQRAAAQAQRGADPVVARSLTRLLRAVTFAQSPDDVAAALRAVTRACTDYTDKHSVAGWNWVAR